MKTIFQLPVILLLFASASVSISWAESILGPITNPSNGHTYFLLNQSSWLDAESQAIGLGGHLVTINDSMENAWVLATFGGTISLSRNLWIGLTDAAVNGTYIWADGSSTSFLNWAPGEPNDASQYPSESQDYVHMWHLAFYQHPGTWNDGPNSMGELITPYAIAQPHGVVEVVPESSTIVLIMFGGGLLLWRKKVTV